MINAEINAKAGSAAAVFSGAGIYGCAEPAAEQASAGCRVYRLSNETGAGQVAVYNVFDGIELCCNDINMAYCCKEQRAGKGLIEINYCTAGRYECTFSENSCCYLAAGETAVAAAARKRIDSGFPLGYYRGFTVLIDPDGLSPEVRRLTDGLGVDLHGIRRYICTENHCCILRGSAEFERVFAGMEALCAQCKVEYLKLRMLELLVLLNDLEHLDGAQKVEYLSRTQVSCAEQTAARITKDLTRHYTIAQLAQGAQVSPTALKKCFKGVYGTSIYAYLRGYRLQTAQKLLEAGLPVAQAAASVGYENPNKFASAFKAEYGCTPTEYKKRVRLDR